MNASENLDLLNPGGEALFDIDDLEVLPIVVEDLTSSAAVHTARRMEEIAAEIAWLDGRRKEAAERLEEERARLRDALPANETVQIGDYQVRRTEVAGSERFSLAAMRKAGEALPKKLEKFVNLSGAHERWTVKRAEQRESKTKKAAS